MEKFTLQIQLCNMPSDPKAPYVSISFPKRAFTNPDRRLMAQALLEAFRPLIPGRTVGGDTAFFIPLHEETP